MEPSSVVRAPDDRSGRLHFHGSGGTLWGIQVVSLLLTLLTLGIYYPWGKTRIRRYLYSQSEMDGDRFAYHGTGKELFFGWLKVSAIFAILLGFSFGLEILWDDEAAAMVGSIPIVLASVLLVPVAIIGSQRYRLARTSWRGIRFSFRGTFREFAKPFWGRSILVPLTLGLYAPFFQNWLRKYLVANSRFGNTAFRYEADGRALFRRFLVALPLTLLTFGFYWYWYLAFRDRYFWEHTHFGGARFRSNVTGGGLLVLELTNLLLLVVTLGLAFAWVRVRSVRYRFDHLVLEGPLDLSAILQQASEASATGEELAEFAGQTLFDVELGL